MTAASPPEAPAAAAAGARTPPPAPRTAERASPHRLSLRDRQPADAAGAGASPEPPGRRIPAARLGIVAAAMSELRRATTAPGRPWLCRRPDGLRQRLLGQHAGAGKATRSAYAHLAQANPVAVSPEPGTPDASPSTQISFLGGSRHEGRRRVRPGLVQRHPQRRPARLLDRHRRELPAQPPLHARASG